MEDLLEGLNEAQREAVTATEGFVRVIAGAGSGKTRALSHRFAFLVNELGILPGNILCVTFTNKSAAEMRQRIHRLTGDDDTGYINTFHGFCVSVLQEDSHVVGYPKSFLVLDNADIDAMLQMIYEERGLSLRDMTFRAARDMIEIRKLFKEPEYYRDMLSLSLDALKQRYLDAVQAGDMIFYGYLYQERKCFGLDYNDLIKFTLHIFQENEAIRLKWQKRLEYIMIDEFQDIDGLQYGLMEVLCGYHRNLFIVGDPDQTIYTWRGANVKYLLDFDKQFPGTKTILMTENYRSTPEILSAANALIAQNAARIPKELRPTLPSGGPVLCHFGENPVTEAGWMAGEMSKLREKGVPYRDMAVLYRAHYVTRAVEGVLLREKIPYTIYSGVPFFSRMEIKDALSYLRMLAYRDDLSFRRIVNAPKRNLGKRRMAFLEEYAAQQGCPLYRALQECLDEPLFKGTRARSFVSLIEGLSTECEGRPVSEVLSAVLNESGYEMMLRTEGSQDRLDNLAELKQAVYEYETTCGEECTLEHYLAHVALFTNSDTGEVGDRVKLMTVHAAKGLEFPYVFLCGMNEGIFPSRKVRTRQGMEEVNMWIKHGELVYQAERKLRTSTHIPDLDNANVGMYDVDFRRDALSWYLSFLLLCDVNQEGLLKAARGYAESSNRALPPDDGAVLLPVGQRVRHFVFGLGRVLDVDLNRGAHLVQFDDMETPRRISFRAKLEAWPEDVPSTGERQNSDYE